MLPRLPQPDDQEQPPSEEARNFATYLALVALVGSGLGFVLLMALVIPRALFVLLALAVVPLYFVFHYLTWGRLMRERPDDDDTPDDQAV